MPFFSKSETSLEMPSGIEALIIDSTAESYLNRRRLFTSLGVKAWEAPEICRLVLKVHESPDFDPKSLTVDQLISHARFLYQASWQPPKTADIWFVTMQDERCMGRKLYIPGNVEKNSPAARIFAQLQKQFSVIHNEYLRLFTLDADWPMWLINNLGLSKIPRFITLHVEPQPQPTQTLEIHKGANTNNKDSDPKKDDLSPGVIVLPSYMAGGKDIDIAREAGDKPSVVDSDALDDFFDDFLGEENPASMEKPGLITSAGNLALQNYQIKLMRLEQQNKKGLMMTRINPDQMNSPQMISAASPLSGLESLPDISQGEPSLQGRQENSLEGILEDSVSSAPRDDNEKKFALSEEFAFMFRECSSSDVLQLLKDN